MAKLTGVLSESSGQAQVTSPIQPDTTASQLANLASQGLSVLSQAKQRQEVQQRAAAIGSAQTDILNLQDEALNLQLRDEELARVTQGIEADGVITAEEQRELDSLQAEVKKLKRARQSGLLNPAVYQTRMNALQKQRLADTANLAIQPEINALFSQGRRFPSAVQSNSMQQLTAEMDQKYGVNNYSGADIGREVGRRNYLAKARQDVINNFGAAMENVNLSSANLYDDAVAGLYKALNEKGAITDEDLDLYRNGITTVTQDALRNFNEGLANARANGFPIDQDAAKAARQSILDNQTFYTNMLKEEGLFESSTRMSQRLKTMQDTLTHLNTIQSPVLAGVMTSMVGGGTNGDLLALAQIAGMSDTQLQPIIDNQPAGAAEYITASTIRENAAQAFAAAMNGVSLKDAASAGLVNRSLAVTVGSMGIRTNFDNKKAKASYISGLELAQYADLNSVLDVMLQDRVFASVSEDSDVSGSPLKAATFKWIEELDSNITPAIRKDLSISPSGALAIERLQGQGARNRRQLNDTLSKFNTYLDKYAPVLGLDKAKLYEDMLLIDEEESEEIPKGTGGRTGRGEQ